MVRFSPRAIPVALAMGLVVLSCGDSREHGTESSDASQPPSDAGLPPSDASQPPADSGEPPSGQAFITGALIAGGRVYQIVARPDDANKLLGCSDVAGIMRSSDGGDRFVPSNNGLMSSADMHIASVHWSTRSSDTAATAYACTDTGIYRTTNDGIRWSLVAGSGGYDCKGNGHFEPKPRQAGRLIVTSNAYLFVGSASAGVGRWDGSSWTNLGLNGSNIQGISLDGSTLYVAVGNSGASDGVHRIDDATGSAAAPTKLTGTNAPVEAWDVVAFNSDVWVAAKGNIHRYRASSWSQWRPAGSASDHFSAIAGGHEGTTPFVYVGLQGGKASNTDPNLAGGVWKTNANTVAWTNLTSAGTKQIDCDSTRPLWTDNFNVIGFPQWRPANISADHAVLRANFWRYKPFAAEWCPTANGLLATGATNIAIDPDSPNDVYASTADYTIIHSSSYGLAEPGETGIEKLRHELPTATTNADRSLAVAFDRTAGDLIATTGNRNIGGNNDADIIRFPKDNFDAKTRIKGNLPDKRVWALGVNRVASCSSSRIIIAALENGGIWRNVGNGSTSTWSQVDSGGVLDTTFGDFPHVTIEWPWGDPNVFLYEPDSGAWRSADCGNTWTQVSTKTASHPFAGFVGYAANSDTLYVSVTNSNDSGNGIFPIANASTCAPAAGNCSHGAALSGAPPRPGAVAVDFDGDLWTVGLSGASVDASLSYWTGSGWIDRSDEVSTGLGLPLRVAVGKSEDSGQYIYVSSKTTGFIRGKK